MLRAALIGTSSTGKTTPLSAHDPCAGRSREEKDVNIGISRVPDLRLDTLTAMHNPRKRVPATIEFADLAAPTRTGAGAQALVDVAAYKNADALVHVVRAFKNPARPHPAGDRSRTRRSTMEDELILADLAWLKGDWSVSTRI